MMSTDDAFVRMAGATISESTANGVGSTAREGSRRPRGAGANRTAVRNPRGSAPSVQSAGAVDQERLVVHAAFDDVGRAMSGTVGRASAPQVLIDVFERV